MANARAKHGDRLGGGRGSNGGMGQCAVTRGRNPVDVVLAGASGALGCCRDNSGWRQRSIQASARELSARTEQDYLPFPLGKQFIRWRGEVLAQKWINFYTKVLSRFASTQGLRLRVSFEVPADDEQSQAKADEARSSLKELGLDDDIQVS